MNNNRKIANYSGNINDKTRYKEQIFQRRGNKSCADDGISRTLQHHRSIPVMGETSQAFTLTGGIKYC